MIGAEENAAEESAVGAGAFLFAAGGRRRRGEIEEREVGSDSTRDEAIAVDDLVRGGGRGW